jgi:hypothetical protein
MDFRPLAKEELSSLYQALRGNVEAEEPIHMGRDTSFLETAQEPITDEETINAVCSVPTHYSFWFCPDCGGRHYNDCVI